MYLSIFARLKSFDIIEFHDYGGAAPYFMGSVPKVIRCHGSAWTLYKHLGYTRRITDDIFEKKMFKRFNKNVIAVSNYSAKITQTAFNLKELSEVISMEL